jgi:ribosome modulation factor
VITEGLPKTVDGRLVLAIAPATPDNTLQYEVSIGGCMLKECPIFVSLVEAGRVLDQTHTRWRGTSRQAMREDITAGWGVGDPGGAPQGMRAWATGLDEDYVGTAARVVALTGRMHGLLIDQRTGFPNTKRHHELFVHSDRRLQRAWSAGERAGTAWTSTAVAPAENGRERVVFFDGARESQSDRPDTLNIARLEWDDARQTVAPQPAAIDASVIAGFQTVAAARAAQSARPDCLGAFWVLPAASVDGAAKGGFVLVMPSVDRDRARASARCASDRKPEMRRLVPN